MAWLSGYTKRISFTITKPNADLTSYPIKLWLDSAGSGIGAKDMTALFADVPDADRLKIAVTLADGTTQCYVEVVSWDAANKKAELYTALTLSSAADTVIYLYYCGASANTTYVGDTTSTPAKAVWDANFVGVWHMNDGADNAHIYDSTSNGNTGTKTGANSPIMSTGVKGKAQTFDITNLILCGTNAVLSISGARTQEAIINLDTGTSTLMDMFGKGYNYPSSGNFGYAFGIDARTTPTLYQNNSGGGAAASQTNLQITRGTDYYVSDWWDGTTNANGWKQYRDLTAYSGASTVAPVTFGAFQYSIGARPSAGGNFKGLISEVRVSNIARPVEWLKATNYSERDTAGTWGAWEVLLTISEGLTSGESITPSMHANVTISEGLTGGETLGKLMKAYPSISEGLTVHDVLSELMSSSRSISEGLSITDTAIAWQVIQWLINILSNIKQEIKIESSIKQEINISSSIKQEINIASTITGSSK